MEGVNTHKTQHNPWPFTNIYFLPAQSILGINYSALTPNVTRGKKGRFQWHEMNLELCLGDGLEKAMYISLGTSELILYRVT